MISTVLDLVAIISSTLLEDREQVTKVRNVNPNISVVVSIENWFKCKLEGFNEC